MKKLIWMKWQDPLRPSVYGEHITKINELEPLTEEQEDASETFPVVKRKNQNDNSQISILVGENGIIPIFETNLPSNMYNLWTGHTNFRITDKRFDAIEKVNGVESVKVYSPYRFRIAIGKVFNPKSVREKIEKALIKPKKTKDLSFNENKLLNRKYKFWAKVYFENNEFDLIVGDTTDEVMQNMEKCQGKITKVEKSWNEQSQMNNS